MATPKKKATPKKSPRSLSKMDPTHFDINERFKLVRLTSNLTQKGFAEKTGLGLPYIKAIEQYKFTPTVAAIKMLHKAFDTPYHWIFEGGRDIAK